MPAAAVIPAPIAYINVVVVKKLVVGSRRAAVGPNCFGTDAFGPCVFADFRAGALDRVSASSFLFLCGSFGACRAEVRIGSFTLKKLGCSKQACPA